MTYLSIIVPVHNEQGRLPYAMARLGDYFTTHRHTEIIFVDNGSTDNTRAMIERYTRVYRPVKAISILQRGKGAAVRAGMLAARGQYCYMCDVDLSTGLNEIQKFLGHSKFADVVIGSRELSPEYTETTITRRAVGRIFHALTRSVVPGIRDTQCGFKLFSARAAQDIFSRAQIGGLAFDVEVLYLARLLGYSTAEISVHWMHNDDSRVRFGSDPLQMLRDVLRIKSLHAQTEKLKAISI
jgi:dolichyl-phosphate beta-glucosyltransferase